MLHKLCLSDLDLASKRVLMRVDFNVPLDKQGNITNDARIVAALPSIEYILNHGASLVLMSHLGRPKGKPDKNLSLAPCAKRLSKLLGKPVALAPDCVGNEVEKMVKALKPGEVLLLENLRFHPGEEKPNEEPNFVQQLASLGDIYVNDAFGTAHRAHASTAQITKYFPNKAAAGFLLEKEIKFLGDALLSPKRPFYAIIGGAKISTKIGVLKSLLEKANKLLIGGGMAYTFFQALGIPIGDSIHEDNLIDEARNILEVGRSKGVPVFLPLDIVIANRLDNNADYKIIDSEEGIPKGWQGVDIGPKTIQAYIREIQDGNTIFWNGPMGVFEMSNFAKGTNAIAQALGQLKAVTIVGGGDSVAAVEAAGASRQITHISTGGGASLEFVELGTLPGLEALSDKQNDKTNIKFENKNRLGGEIRLF